MILPSHTSNPIRAAIRAMGGGYETTGLRNDN